MEDVVIVGKNAAMGEGFWDIVSQPVLIALFMCCERIGSADERGERVRTGASNSNQASQCQRINNGNVLFKDRY
jgi:hypothetical protein